MLKRIPTGRMGEVGEIANLAGYLVSDYANWITGEVCVNCMLEAGEGILCYCVKAQMHLSWVVTF